MFHLFDPAKRKELEKLWLKNCVAYPILRYFDVTGPALLYTDASYCSIGAVLGQIDKQRRQYVCEYFDRALRKHEKNYSVSEIALLSVVEAATPFRVYSASDNFKTIADHKALMSMTSITSPTSPRLKR